MAAHFTKFTQDEQDPKAVERVFHKISDLLSRDEEILYIAIQKRPAVSLLPDSVLVTSRRVFICSPSNLGLSMNYLEFTWNEVKDVAMKEEIFGAKFIVTLKNGNTELVEFIPKVQARKLYRSAKDVMENALASGGLTNQNPSSSNSTLSADSAMNAAIDKDHTAGDKDHTAIDKDLYAADTEYTAADTDYTATYKDHNLVDKDLTSADKDHTPTDFTTIPSSIIDPLLPSDLAKTPSITSGSDNFSDSSFKSGLSNSGSSNSQQDSLFRQHQGIFSNQSHPGNENGHGSNGKSSSATGVLTEEELTQKLLQLKSLFDRQLISRDDYESKKTELLARFL